MNIWLFQIGEQPPFVEGNRKLRTAMLAEALAARGHSVLWWSSKFDHQRKHWIESSSQTVHWKPGIDIVLLSGCGYRRNVSITRFLDHRIIAYQFKRMARAFPKPDLVIASMPTHDLAYQAINFANRVGAASIVDIRDQWPDIIETRFKAPWRQLVHSLLFHDRRMLRDCLSSATALVSMQEELLKWGTKKVGRPKREFDRVFYLGCAKHRAPEISSCAKLSKIFEDVRGNLVVTFIGTFGHYYWPELVIEAAKTFIGMPVRFILGGDGEYLPRGRELAKLLPHVHLPGWLDSQEIAALLSISDIGVCPTREKLEAFPNKAFLYLSAGIPILHSCSGEMETLLTEYRAGIYFSPNDIRQLSDAISDLITNPEELARLRANARVLFQERLDSDLIYKEYAEFAETIVERKRISP